MRLMLLSFALFLAAIIASPADLHARHRLANRKPLFRARVVTGARISPARIATVRVAPAASACPGGVCPLPGR